MLRARKGFAFPMAIMMTAILTGTIAAALTLVSSERRTADNQRAQLDAFAYAEAGLEQFLVNRDSLGFVATPPAAAESVRVSFARGYADVVLQQIRPAVGTSAPLYVVRSRGASTLGGYGATPAAERTVAQLAVYRTGRMRVLSAWTSITGLTKNGGSGVLSGTDNCAAAPPVAGIAVPSGGYNQSGGTSVPSGTPPIQGLGSQSQAADSVKIDWAGISNGTAVTPDIVWTGIGSWPSFSNASYWPVILVDNDNTSVAWDLPGDGRGTLIVTGNMSMGGSKEWDGVILVGGTLTSNGTNEVRGATISGLNVKLGQTVGTSDVGNGTKTFQYDSCNIASAMARFGALQVYQNAWMDNWKTY